MAAETITQLQWATLTAAVNEIKSPNTFLKNLLWSRSEELPTETIEVSTLHGDHVAAPFVKRDGKSIMVAGRTKTWENITGPNIRISRPLKGDDLLFGRYPATSIFADAATISAAIDKKIADEMAVLADMVAEREEWMCAMALRNTLSYSTDDAAFDITFNRDATLDTALGSTVGWDDSGSHPWRDFRAAKKLISKFSRLGCDTLILGETAAQAFVEHAEVKAQIDTTSGINAGNVTLQNQFSDDGAILIGRFSGINVWEYTGVVNTPESGDVALIRTDYAEFVSTSPAADRIMYYAAIPDLDALEGKLFVGKRFAKSWRESDPSAQMALIHSRPFPVPRRPNAAMSLKVTNT